MKTKSRASDSMESFTGKRGSKTGTDWVVYLFSVGLPTGDVMIRRGLVGVM